MGGYQNPGSGQLPEPMKSHTERLGAGLLTIREPTNHKCVPCILSSAFYTTALYTLCLRPPENSLVMVSDDEVEILALGCCFIWIFVICHI